MLTLLLFSCDRNKKVVTSSPNDVLTEQQKRKIFLDSCASNDNLFLSHNRNINFFLNKYYPNIELSKISPTDAYLLYILEDDYFNQPHIDSARQVIRLLIAPALEFPYGITLEFKNNQTYITTKLTHGLKGTYCEYLKNSYLQLLQSDIYNKLLKNLNEVDVDKLNLDKSPYGCKDGELVTFEILEHGKYSYFSKRNPFCSTDSNTIRFWEIASSLIKISKFNELTSISDRQKNGM
jgi:hypothetical protein